jgi:hypothetical protein
MKRRRNEPIKQEIKEEEEGRLMEKPIWLGMDKTSHLEVY